MRDDDSATMVLREKQRHQAQFEEAGRRPGKPVYLRHEQRHNWREPLPIYAFYCKFCDAYSVSHPCGYYAKVRCDDCNRYGTVPEHAIEHPTSLFQALLRAAIIRFQTALCGAREAFGLNDDPRLPPPKE